MKGKRKMKIFLIVIVIIIACCAAFYKPVINYLVGQSANPTGFIGSLMTRIWSVSFQDQNQWGLSLLNIADEGVILSVGFGSGSGIKQIKEQGAKNTVYGIDISEEAVNMAASLNQTYIDAGEVILSIGDVAYLEFDNGFFDVVIAGQTHIYWSELERGLSECLRVLAENGTLLITCEIDKIEYHLPEYRNSDDFVKLLYTVGFAEVDVRGRGNYIAFICRK